MVKYHPSHHPAAEDSSLNTTVITDAEHVCY